MYDTDGPWTTTTSSTTEPVATTAVTMRDCNVDDNKGSIIIREVAADCTEDNTDGSSSSLPNPEELRTSYTSRSTSNKKGFVRVLLSISIFCLMLSIIITSIVVVTSDSRDSTAAAMDDSSQLPPEQEQQQQQRPYYDDIVEFIVSNRISSESEIDQYLQSPQSHAVNWLMNDDPMNVPVPSYNDNIRTYTGYMYMVRYVMAVNYFALLSANDGDDADSDSTTNLFNFLSNNHVCNWNTIGTNVGDDDMGIFCRELPDFFDENTQELVPYMLHIEQYLSGTIPTENAMLTTLQVLNLSNNVELTGSIPIEICNVINLQSLQLHNNNLTGSIPDCFYQLSKLELLDISQNQIVSTIPDTICTLLQLNELHMNDNALYGGIPACLGTLSSLIQLVLSNNLLNGVLPNELCTLTNLLYFNVYKNDLSSTIPSCIGSMLALQTLDVSDNSFDGTIPIELTFLNKTLENIILEHNYFNGDPTGVLDGLNNLRTVILGHNEFSFTMDTMFLYPLMNVLEHLDISNNTEISGPFPNHMIQNFPLLQCLDVSLNQITGEFTFPTDVENAVLEVLSVQKNQMSGPISSLAALSQLVYLDISDNQFTGDIESNIGQLQQLRALFLNDNPFTPGPIPESFGSYQFIEALSLRNTSRTGSLLNVPVGNNTWMLMRYLDFGSNNLEGNIPTSYGQLSTLEYFLFFDNEFIIGNIPEEFRALTQLVGLFLDGTSIDTTSVVSSLCATLPNFGAASNDTEKDISLVFNCLGECYEECSADCQCCDIQNPTGCTSSNLDEYDTTFHSIYRRISNFHNVYMDIASTYDNP